MNYGMTFDPHGPDLFSRVGRIRVKASEWIGRSCIDICGPDTDMFLVGGGSSIPIIAPGLCVGFLDDPGSPGRYGLNSLTGDARELETFLDEALYNAHRLGAGLRPVEVNNADTRPS